MNKKVTGKKATSQSPKLRDLLPKLEGVGSLWVSNTLVTIIAEMVALAKTQDTNDDLKSIVSNLDMRLGWGIMPPVLRKLVALVTELCRWVKDGDDSVKLAEYVKGRLVYAAYKHGTTGRDLLEDALLYVKNDLRDCKADTVRERRRMVERVSVIRIPASGPASVQRSLL